MLKVVHQNKYFLSGFILVSISFLISYNIPFFWDGLSKSLRANWFYSNHFSKWVVPTDINSGHPPLWTLLLATSWTWFGKSLLTSRILLYILNIAVVYQLQQLIKQYKSPNITWYWYLILFIEPTYLAQTTILNNDVLMLFMSLLALNNLHKNKILYSLGLLGVLFCNLRGMLFFTGFFMYEFLCFIFKQKVSIKTSIQKLTPYLIPFISFVSFLYYQYQVLGWIIKSKSGNWEGQRQLVGIKHFVHNIFATGWVFADFGKFFFWIVLLSLLYVFLKKKKTIPQKTLALICISCSLLAINIIVMTLSSNPIGHRYFMLFYLLGLLLFVNFTLEWFKEQKRGKLIVITASMLLISGHFWIYPKKLPQGWDSSLAYLNYFKIKKEMQQFVLENKINPKDIGTKTRNPNLETEYLIQGKQITYQIENTIDNHDYYVCSNIENSTSDDEIDLLENKWLLVKEFNNRGIFIRLYQSPTPK